MRVCRERSVFGLKRAENDLATVAGLAVNHYDGDAQRMRASIGQNDFMCKQCQQAKMVARTDFWDGPTVCFLPASHELLLSAFGPNGHGSMWRGMDDAVAVVAGLAADEFNRIPGRAHTRNERIGLLGRVLALWFRLEPSPRRHRGGRRHRRGRKQSAPRRWGMWRSCLGFSA